MSISLEELSKTDFSEVTTGEEISLSTPGDILRREFMEPLGLSANALARAIRVPPNRITAILKGTRSITADTALRLGRYFGTTAEFWLNLQKDYELRVARRKSARRIEAEVEPLSSVG
ncbi:antitoxin HigA-1 [Methylomarinovum caldicuralii]|uniref:Antitoxin HigA-1 n=1 Tax=Methylomarinovum caldicuralii TaxID=438856 RepID=A0AAU9C3A6_9GAMM|nr:HigA family addiction module antitoxin [Methylomarinovum caldicuralii]BCX81624.1 antitoxin HigA-1 [Methylomarinovum caldicuralii]